MLLQRHHDGVMSVLNSIGIDGMRIVTDATEQPKQDVIVENKQSAISCTKLIKQWYKSYAMTVVVHFFLEEVYYDTGNISSLVAGLAFLSYICNVHKYIKVI